MIKLKSLSALVLCLFVGAQVGCAKPVGIYQTLPAEKFVYATHDGVALSMDVVAPKRASGIRPALLWFHGGGFAIGRRNDSAAVTEFFASLGYVAFSADYRLTLTGARYPAIIKDVTAAFRYVRDNAARYGVDPDNIVVGGDSAGAHLAMMLGINEPGVRAVIDLYGSTDLVSLATENRGWLRPIILLMMGKKDQDNLEAWRAASPLYALKPESPPILVMHGDCDVVIPIAQSEALFRRSREIGARVTFIRVPNAQHGWTLVPWGSDFVRTLPVMAHFIAKETCYAEDPYAVDESVTEAP